MAECEPVIKIATHSERESFVADLIRHAPASDVWFATRLMRYSGTYHRLAEKDGQRTPAEQKKFARIKATIKDLCFDIRCQAEFHGQTFTVILPDGYTTGVPKI